MRFNQTFVPADSEGRLDSTLRQAADRCQLITASHNSNLVN